MPGIYLESYPEHSLSVHFEYLPLNCKFLAYIPLMADWGFSVIKY